jgi:hypothetical protein
LIRQNQKSAFFDLVCVCAVAVAQDP